MTADTRPPLYLDQSDAVKRALVTGCSRGIGKAVTEMLLAEDWEVLGISRTPPGWLQQRFHWQTLDLAGPLAGPSLRDVIDHRLDGQLDALVHCAAIRPEGDVATMAPAEWRRCVLVNLLGTYTVVRTVLPSLHRSDDARVLLFSGGGAFSPAPGFSAYAASKGGIVALMESLAAELRDSTVTVNCVAPGYVPTTMHDRPVPDGGEAMAEAVACVRHLLGPQAYGLSGKTISAPHDDWRSITPLTVARVNASAMGTRSRHPIALVGARRGVAV